MRRRHALGPRVSGVVAIVVLGLWAVASALQAQTPPASDYFDVSADRSELKKVTWPSRKEVYQTTLVVIATSIFFGFYLWGLDLVFSWVMSHVLRGNA